MESVNVLVRIDGCDDARGVDLRRQRQLHQDTAYGGVCIQALHQGNQRLFADFVWQTVIERPHACFDDRFRLAADIGLAGGIFADKHHCQTGCQALLGH